MQICIFTMATAIHIRAAAGDFRRMVSLQSMMMRNQRVVYDFRCCDSCYALFFCVCVPCFEGSAKKWVWAKQVNVLQLQSMKLQHCRSYLMAFLLHVVVLFLRS